MWITQTTIPTLKQFESNIPARKDFLHNPDYNYLDISNLTKSDSLLSIIEFKSRFSDTLLLKSNLDRLNANLDIIYIDDSTQYTEVNLHDIGDSKQAVKPNKFYTSFDLPTITLCNHETASVYATVRLELSNIGSLADIVQFINISNLQALFLKLFSSSQSQQISITYLNQHAFSLGDVVTLDYRFKIYDNNIPILPVINTIASRKTAQVKRFNHFMEDWDVIDQVIYKNQRFNKLNGSSEVTDLSFLINNEFIHLIEFG